MKKILIIQTAYIGDVILATSLVEQLSYNFPEAKIDFLLRDGNQSLLQEHPLINRIYIWNKKKKYSSMLSLLKEIRATKYDYCLNIQRFFNSGLFTFFSKAREKVIFDKNPLSFLFKNKVKHLIPHKNDSGYYHEVQRNMQLLAKIKEVSIPSDPKELPLSLYTSEHSKKKIENITKVHPNYLVMAPSSVWFTKQFSKFKWIELKNKLQHFHLFFIGAPTDFDYLESIILDSNHCTNLAGKLSLLDSAQLMKDATRVLVNDSAPLHLASAVQAKTTAIFCSTVPEFGYGPLSKESIVIEVQEKLDCRPCGLHGKKECPLGHFKCSKEISIQSIIDTI